MKGRTALAVCLLGASCSPQAGPAGPEDADIPVEIADARASRDAGTGGPDVSANVAANLPEVRAPDAGEPDRPARDAGEPDRPARDAGEPSAADASAVPSGRNPLTGMGPLQKIREGLSYAEGPTWVAKQNHFVFSDIRGGKALYKVALPGAMSLFRTVMDSNGNAVDGAGDLYSNQNGQVVRTREGRMDAVAEMLADISGTPLDGRTGHLPNDIVVRGDGTVYVTSLRAGEARGNLGVVWMLRPPSHAVQVAHRGKLKNPNGVALSPDQKFLYVIDAFYAADKVPGYTLTHNSSVWRFEISADGTLDAGQMFLHVPGSGDGVTQPDGMAVDDDGNLYVTNYKGIDLFSSGGTRWGKIAITPDPRNCTFGGPDRKTLFVTAKTDLYTIRMPIAGAP